jgi:hypothetical protein
MKVRPFHIYLRLFSLLVKSRQEQPNKHFKNWKKTLILFTVGLKTLSPAESVLKLSQLIKFQDTFTSLKTVSLAH